MIRTVNSKEAAKILQKKEQTLANDRLNGRGPAWSKLSGRIVYLVEDLEEYIKEHRFNHRDTKRLMHR